MVTEVIDTARGGTLLSEALYQGTLDQTPAFNDQSDREAVALAVRHLSDFCVLDHFRWTEKWLEQGVSAGDLRLEVERMNGKVGRTVRYPRV